MFGRLVRSLVGGFAPAARPDEDKASVDDIVSIPSAPLRALFEDRYRREAADHAEAGREADAAYAAALADDPLPVAVALIRRAPIMTMLLRENRPELRRLDFVFERAAEAALRAIRERYGPDAPIPDSDLPPVLHALGVLVAQGTLVQVQGYRAWLEPVVRAAGRSRDPAVRRALLAMFDLFEQGNPYQRDESIRVAEELLPLTGLDRSEIPLLSGKDKASAERDAVRARIRADAGPLLWGAIEAGLDNEGPAANYVLREAEKHPAIKALTDQPPEGRGESFHLLLDILTGFDRYGIASWGLLERTNKRYRIGAVANDHPRGIGNVLGALATRKMALSDPDGDSARLLAVLPCYPGLHHRRILAFLLETARAHPAGATVRALRELIGKRRGSAYFTQWGAEIEDALRDLAAAGASGPGGPRVSVPISGRRSAGAGAGGFPPIELPRFAVNLHEDQLAFVRHFDALFDVRLHDAAHRTFLSDLAALAEAIDALPAADRAARVAEIGRLARAAGFTIVEDRNPMRFKIPIEHFAALGRDLHRRFTTFAPFVTAHPETARKLGKLATAIASKSAPPARWLEEGRALFADVPREERLALLRTLVEAPTPEPFYGQSGGEQYLRALLYLSADLDPATIGPMLTDYALRQCYVTVPNVGIRAEKLGNACLWTLAAMPEGAGVPYLARILARTKYPKIRAKIDEKLNQAAEAASLSRGALDELTVPTHGLDRDGAVRFPVGDGEAVVRIDGARDVSVAFLSGAGKALKSPSAAMKADKAALKEARDRAKEIEADLGTLTVRLQRLYLDDRSWPAAEWRERYLDHPLVRSLARRLIWRVEAPGGIATAALADEAGGTMLDVSGRPVPLEDARIRLWHPIEAEVAEVEAWRDRLEALETVQPFAQAWREIYALTEAERRTGTYSNRWAAHILKQHQAMTLARLNGWRVTHRMWVDAPNDEPWHLTIPAHGLVADYWVEGAGGDTPEVSDSGAYTYVATDRVQFHGLLGEAADSARGPARAVPTALADVPPIVFSEVMRHADLFTSVASIAADPNWLDRGGEAAHPNQWANLAADYWNRTNTAELEESGKRRRAMLERIIRRLKLADRLKLDDRHLLVEGKRHRYRIHLGSGACFRGERHLCIVPKAAEGTGRIWLPFEGDRTLSIILSKALLLADDDRITDPVILAQL